MSRDAEWRSGEVAWFTSGDPAIPDQQVTVGREDGADPDTPVTFSERAQVGMLRTYVIQLSNGQSYNAFEDELSEPTTPAPASPKPVAASPKPAARVVVKRKVLPPFVVYILILVLLTLGGLAINKYGNEHETRKLRNVTNGGELLPPYVLSDTRRIGVDDVICTYVPTADPSNRNGEPMLSFETRRQKDEGCEHTAYYYEGP